MADMFNEFFSSIFTRKCHNIDLIPAFQLDHDVPQMGDIEETVFTKPVNLKSNQSAGSNGWPVVPLMDPETAAVHKIYI